MALFMRRSVALAVSALAIRANGFILEQNSDIPDGWKLADQNVNPEQPTRLSIALRGPDLDELRSQLVDPAKKHISRADAQRMRAADQDDVEAVQNWLLSQGLSDSEEQDDWIHVYTTVEEAESLLDASIRFYQFEDHDPVLRTREYSIPDNLRDAISFIHPIANFMTPKTNLPRPSKYKQHGIVRRDAPCAETTDPDCIRKLYNMPDIAPAANSTIRLGIAGFLEQFANYNDLHVFLKKTAASIAATGYNFSVELVNGGENSQHPAKAGSEAALDVQYAMALGFPTKVTYYSTGGRGVKLNDKGESLKGDAVDNEPYLEFLEHLLAKPDDEIPHVLSFSYADDELSVPRPYAERVCAMFGLLAARGVSVLGGSGDGGATGSLNSSCQTHGGKPAAMAVFPATCPWVTAVGSVTNGDEPPQGSEFSGGGFSQYFAREAWQDSAVKTYVEALDGRMSGKYNASMRAVPDISAVGEAFTTVVAFQRFKVDGTSASTPLLAAMIALVNDARVKAGKPVLGWLNQRLYSDEIKSEILDITEGTSMACDFEDGQDGSWPAKEGWDAITGLGVPRDFQRLLKALVQID